MVRWAKLEENWHKLNIDGSAVGNPSIAGGGGVVRDHNGQWVIGFARAINIASSVEVKL